MHEHLERIGSFRERVSPSGARARAHRRPIQYSNRLCSAKHLWDCQWQSPLGHIGQGVDPRKPSVDLQSWRTVHVSLRSHRGAEFEKSARTLGKFVAFSAELGLWSVPSPDAVRWYVSPTDGTVVHLQSSHRCDLGPRLSLSTRSPTDPSSSASRGGANFGTPDNCFAGRRGARSRICPTQLRWA